MLHFTLSRDHSVQTHGNRAEQWKTDQCSMFPNGKLSIFILIKRILQLSSCHTTGPNCMWSCLFRQYQNWKLAFVLLSVCNNPTWIREALKKGLGTDYHHHYVAHCFLRIDCCPKQATGWVSCLGASVGLTETAFKKNYIQQQHEGQSGIPQTWEIEIITACDQRTNIRSHLPPCLQTA